MHVTKHAPVSGDSAVEEGDLVVTVALAVDADAPQQLATINEQPAELLVHLSTSHNTCYM